jgi:hypothetical protein
MATGVASGERGVQLSVPVEEPHDVVQPEPAIAALADSVEGQFAPVAQPLHRVDVKVEHGRDFASREHRTQFIYGHCSH